MLNPVQFEIHRVIEWDEWKHECIPRLKYAAKLEIPHLPQLTPHDGVCTIVGAGPSVEKHVDKIRELRNGKNLLMSVNAMHEWLLNHDLIPNIHVVFEHDIEDITECLGGQPHKDVAYYISSHCPKKIFVQLADYTRVLWHAFCGPQGYQRAIDRYFPGEFMVAGGYATSFRALTIAIILGYRNFDLFGLDSSFEGSSHIDGYELSDIEPRVNVWGKDPRSGFLKKFTTQGGLAFQAAEFVKFCEINQPGLKIRVHGDGLLRYLHESRYPEQYKET